jgi:hypothetical protein
MENNTVTIPKGCLPYLMINVAGPGLCFAEALEAQGIQVVKMRRTKDGWKEVTGSSAESSQEPKP